MKITSFNTQEYKPAGRQPANGESPFGSDVVDFASFSAQSVMSGLDEKHACNLAATDVRSGLEGTACGLAASDVNSGLDEKHACNLAATDVHSGLEGTACGLGASDVHSGQTSGVECFGAASDIHSGGFLLSGI